MTNLRQINKAFLIPAGVSVVVILPILFLGIHESTDLNQHIQFASTFYHSILTGDFYPSWSGEENFGYGSVGLRFYPPLFQFLLALARSLTGDWQSALSIVLLIFSFAGVVGVYMWAKEFVSDKEAAVAAAVFALMPYQLSQIYTSAFYAQFCAISILPFSFLFVTKICRGGRVLHIIGLAVSLSIVILLNLPAAVIGCLSLLVYSLLTIGKRKPVSSVTKLSVAVLIALLATVFYWMRAYPELEFFRNTRFWADQTFNWREHFLLTKPSKVVFGIWFNNQILVTTILLTLCGLAGLSWARPNRKLPGLRPIVILFVIAVFMMTPLSLPLWLYLPYLNEVQFPERWQTITSLTGAVLFATGGFGFIQGMRARISIRNPRIWLAVLVFLAVVTVFYQLSSKYSRPLIPASQFNAWCENDINSLGFEFFWTLEAKKEAFAVTDRIVAPHREFQIADWKADERRFHLSSGPAEDVRVAVLYYPRWEATVNGVPVQPSAADDGAILIPIPSAESDVRLWFQESWYAEKANQVSAATWLLLLVCGLYVLIANFYLPKGRSGDNDL